MNDGRMTNVRRRAAMALSAMTCAMTLTACGGGADDIRGASPSADAAADDVMTLELDDAASAQDMPTEQKSRVITVPPPVKKLFVALNGNDANPGTFAAPLRSVQRCADLAEPGTACVLRAGVYRETVRPGRSGLEGAPIIFAAWKNEAVTLTGADPVEGWSLHQGAIYRTQAALPVAGNARDDAFGANQLFASGDMLPQARYPNAPTGPLRFMKPGLANSGVALNGREMRLTNPPEIPGGWSGAVFWSTEWFVSRTAKITSDTAGVAAGPVSDQSNWDRAPFWWTLTGALGALDAPGEWHYDDASQTLYLWAPDGGLPTGIEAKQREFAFDLRGRSHIVVAGLNIHAATITSDEASSHLKLLRLDMRYVSHYLTLPDLPAGRILPGTDNFGLIGAHTHDTGVQLRGRNHLLASSRVRYSAGNLVLLEGQGHAVLDNELHDANYLSSYAAAVQVVGNGHRLMHNRIFNTGRSAINVDWKLTGFRLADVEIAYNDISSFGHLSTDLGAIYVCCRIDAKGTRLHHNRIHDSQHFSIFWDVAAIYFDLNSYNATIDHNVVYNFWFERGRSLKIGNEFADSLERVFNNTFLPPSDMGGRIEARNNVFFSTNETPLTIGSNNLFAGTDPLFTDAANGDFTLMTGSPAVDAGIFIPGFTRNAVNAPDIGAYEAGRPAWKAGPRIALRPPAR